MADPTVSDTIREKREAIVRIAAKHGATQVRRIGSVARGEARLRLTVTAAHTRDDLDQALEAVERAFREFALL